jgi:hypothetical protein
VTSHPIGLIVIGLATRDATKIARKIPNQSTSAKGGGEGGKRSGAGRRTGAKAEIERNDVAHLALKILGDQTRSE